MVHEPLDADTEDAEVSEFLGSYSIKSPLGTY